MTKLAFANGLVLAVQTIRSHKMRAFLTVLGVIIGTGTIIGVAAILTGFDASMTAVLRSFGPNSIIVFRFPVGFRVGNLSPEERTRKQLTYENAIHLRQRCPSCEDVSAMLFPNRGPITAHYKGNDIYRIDLRVPYDKPDTFALSTAEQMVADFRQITAMTFLVMVVLSSTGLLVGGIGVMNIMLVSVTERTYEIGIRKALGARKADILIQFLIEAAALTGLGGICGIILRWLLSVIARLVFSSLPASVPLWSAVLGIVVSVGIGLFFGIWPANKAARLDPVVALRYE